MNAKLLLLVSIFFFTISCNKDTPKRMSLVEKRMVNHWVMETFHVNGKDETRKFVKSFILYTNKDRTFSLSIAGDLWLDFFEEGSWELSNEQKELVLNFKAAAPDPSGMSTGPQVGGDERWQILRSENGIFWLQQNQTNGDVWEVHLKPYSCCK